MQEKPLDSPADLLPGLLWDSGVLDFGEFVLTSGKKSPYYVDLRLLPSSPHNFDRAVELCVEILESKRIKFDKICGVATGGLPLATLLANKTETPLTYVRASKKEHGEEQRVEGGLAAGNRVLVVDDIVTTGGSLIEAVKSIRREGAEVKDCLVLVDREEGGTENLRDENVTLQSVGNISSIVNRLEEQGKLSTNQTEKVRAYIGRGE